MVKSRATMKCWPIVVVCMQTGATHLMLAHDYGTEAFMLQWSGFADLRGLPRLVVSDRGSQLVSAASKILQVGTGQQLLLNLLDISRHGSLFLQVHSGELDWRNHELSQQSIP